MIFPDRTHLAALQFRLLTRISKMPMPNDSRLRVLRGAGLVVGRCRIGPNVSIYNPNIRFADDCVVEAGVELFGIAAIVIRPNALLRKGTRIDTAVRDANSPVVIHMPITLEPE